jgi:hypothetical protein
MRARGVKYCPAPDLMSSAPLERVADEIDRLFLVEKARDVDLLRSRRDGIADIDVDVQIGLRAREPAIHVNADTAVRIPVTDHLSSRRVDV